MDSSIGIANKLPKSRLFHFTGNKQHSATTGLRLWQVQVNIEIKVLTVGPLQGSLETEIMDVTAFASYAYL